MTRGIEKIVSGGQTGVDRGALDAAIRLGIEHGGWCPRGRLAEDGVIPHQYQLRETEERDYWFRTERNIIDSDGTVILYCQAMRGGTQFTYRMARKHGRPFLLVDLDQQPNHELVRRWIDKCQLKILNVAGPRESTSPGITRRAEEFMLRVLQELD